MTKDDYNPSPGADKKHGLAKREKFGLKIRVAVEFLVSQVIANANDFLKPIKKI